MYGNVLVVFGVFWGGLGYFEAVGFQKRNLAHYMYGDGLVVFGVFWVGLGYFEAVGFQKRNLAHYMYGDHCRTGNPLARTNLSHFARCTLGLNRHFY